VLPDGSELCDGLDSDCDGTVPGDEADEDGDGVRICAGDCDDTLPTVHEGADELCDGVDNDCDEALDPDEADLDGDDHVVCEPVEGSGLLGGDCDDDRSTVHPAAVQDFCDGLDSDCDGVLPDDELDADGDGWLPCDDFLDTEPAEGVLGGGDCMPDEVTVNPAAAEAACDGFDTDCDGLLIAGEEDADGDEHLACDEADCDDADPAVFIGADELCDAVDQDCDGDLVEAWDDRDDDGLPDCAEEQPSLAAAPGCEAGCSTGDRRSGGLRLAIPLVLVAARRRRA